MASKLLRKITIGGINGIRGGFKAPETAFGAMTVIGIAQSYKEFTSETMGVSYGFTGEFRAINKDGVESVAPVVFIPEPAQGLLKAALDQEGLIGGVKFGFHFNVVPDETAIRGYYFECEPLTEPKPSDALAGLAAELGYEPKDVKALGHDESEAVETGKEAAPAKPKRK